MKNYVKFTVKRDDDGTGEVFAEFSIKGFLGRGSAWFDMQSLSKSADEFNKFPLGDYTKPILLGGYWSKNSLSEIDQEHLAVSAYKINNTGGVAVQVRVASKLNEGMRPESQFKAVVEIETTYEYLSHFSKQLKALALGQCGEAVLKGCWA